tara:strand:+ start:5101 stop:5484 length:384 start_codon:yes stop_codon:yes gene_type:complete
MKTPIVKFNNKILDRISIFMKVNGITLYPYIIIRDNPRRLWSNSKQIHKDIKLINHESIHIKQQEELLVLPFYILYGVEWLIKFSIYRDAKKAYKNISFEREAYDNESVINYLEERVRYNWFNRIIR